MDLDRDKIFGELEKGTFMWCMHCERTYLHGEYRIEKLERDEESLQMCPYKDCDGDTVIDSKEWSSIREYHQEYPEKPEKGVVYPLH